MKRYFSLLPIMRKYLGAENYLISFTKFNLDIKHFKTVSNVKFQDTTKPLLHVNILKFPKSNEYLLIAWRSLNSRFKESKGSNFQNCDFAR